MKMYAIMVKYDNGTMAFYPNCKVAAREWGCAGQTVLNMMRHCIGWKQGEKMPLRNSRVAAEHGIIFIAEVNHIEDLNQFEDKFVWSNNKS